MVWDVSVPVANIIAARVGHKGYGEQLQDAGLCKGESVPDGNCMLASLGMCVGAIPSLYNELDHNGQVRVTDYLQQSMADAARLDLVKAVKEWDGSYVVEGGERYLSAIATKLVAELEATPGDGESFLTDAIIPYVFRDLGFDPVPLFGMVSLHTGFDMPILEFSDHGVDPSTVAPGHLPLIWVHANHCSPVVVCHNLHLGRCGRASTLCCHQTTECKPLPKSEQSARWLS
mmetsp:Transcript_19033/g.48367  ORF Transcript_19033/g.48367 Transcript_19033/m.48367 type:complete len:231 (-) Transcript_19033:220-912(-)